MGEGGGLFWKCNATHTILSTTINILSFAGMGTSTCEHSRHVWENIDGLEPTRSTKLDPSRGIFLPLVGLNTEPTVYHHILQHSIFDPYPRWIGHTYFFCFFLFFFRERNILSRWRKHTRALGSQVHRHDISLCRYLTIAARRISILTLASMQARPVRVSRVLQSFFPTLHPPRPSSARFCSTSLILCLLLPSPPHHRPLLTASPLLLSSFFLSFLPSFFFLRSSLPLRPPPPPLPSKVLSRLVLLFLSPQHTNNLNSPPTPLRPHLLPMEETASYCSGSPGRTTVYTPVTGGMGECHPQVMGQSPYFLGPGNVYEYDEVDHHHNPHSLSPHIRQAPASSYQSHRHGLGLGSLHDVVTKPYEQPPYKGFCEPDWSFNKLQAPQDWTITSTRFLKLSNVGPAVQASGLFAYLHTFGGIQDYNTTRLSEGVCTVAYLDLRDAVSAYIKIKTNQEWSIQYCSQIYCSDVSLPPASIRPSVRVLLLLTPSSSPALFQRKHQLPEARDVQGNLHGCIETAITPDHPNPVHFPLRFWDDI